MCSLSVFLCAARCAFSINNLICYAVQHRRPVSSTYTTITAQNNLDDNPWDVVHKQSNLTKSTSMLMTISIYMTHHHYHRHRHQISSDLRRVTMSLWMRQIQVIVVYIFSKCYTKSSISILILNKYASITLLRRKAVNFSEQRISHVVNLTELVRIATQLIYFRTQ